jgi:hypothetical protein
MSKHLEHEGIMRASSFFSSEYLQGIEVIIDMKHHYDK